jgi:hypothetical protein
VSQLDSSRNFAGGVEAQSRGNFIHTPADVKARGRSRALISDPKLLEKQRGVRD